MTALVVDIPRTGGALRPITVVTKPGTVRRTSSCRTRRRCAASPGYRISDVMNGALAQFVPERFAAAGDGGSTLAWFAGRVDDEPFVFNELVVGTWGGRPGRDGNDGLANPCASIANVPVEVAETEWPIVVERYGFVAGLGRRRPLPRRARDRAGLAVRCPGHGPARPLRPAGPPSVRPRRRPAGRRLVELIVRANGDRRVAAADVRRPLQPGDVFHHRMAGGGGWGDPRERDRDAAARDLANGKVTA